MTELLQAAFDYARLHLGAAGLVFLRVGAVMALLPAFGERVVPGRIRLALAFAFSAIIAPAVTPRLPTLTGVAEEYALFLAAETLNGLALGFVLRLLLLAVEMAGNLAAQSSSLAQMFGAAGEPMPAMSHLLMNGALCLAVAGGLHVRAAAALILSYEALPAGVFPGAELMRAWSVGHISHAFGLSFSLAVPFLAAALIYNVALGVTNRAMPALMVSFIGAPALTAGALALLAVVAPLALSVWWAAFADVLADPFSVPR